MGLIGWIGDTGGIETGPFVGDLDSYPPRRHAAGDANVLLRVRLVAVLDGIDQGFLQRQMDAEEIALGPMEALEVIEDLLEDPLSHAGFAGNEVVAPPGPGIFGRHHGWFKRATFRTRRARPLHRL